MRKKLYPRELYLKRIRPFYRENELIKVITGVRRCGKSSLMQLIANELIRDGVDEENIVYINVANNLSIDCDCNSNPQAPKMQDIGIFASTDPVAIDQSCYDTIMNSADEGKDDLVNRMLDKHAIHIVEEAENLGLGNRNYEIIDIDNKGNV